MRASIAVAVLLASSVSQAADDAPRVRAALAVERMEDATLRAGYSVTNVTRDSGFQAELDLDGDGRIGFGDFFLFASSFGTILPAE